jgi:CO/xanthine dehydrogenase FAD-binding subunit
MKYYRPGSVEEALELLQGGIPLAGGTVLTPRRYSLEGVVDIRDLGLSGITLEGGWIAIGAGAVIQDLFSMQDRLPSSVIRACRLEANLNLRNMMTFGGMLSSSDARSPLLTMLVALDAHIDIEPGERHLPVRDFLEFRSREQEAFLITGLGFLNPQGASYEQVSRSPGDFPLVCAAGSMHPEGEGRTYRVALGGFGDEPVRMEWSPVGAAAADLLGEATAWAETAYAQAGDPFASAEYRAEIAGVLARRVLQEVLA